ncbi:MAG: hypothetical protein C4B55_00400 [Candidatus Methanophagaceae archaeon]|nr:MAG: hypothetical protein C4B55_00400 [Methanophagales archaeon]
MSDAAVAAVAVFLSVSVGAVIYFLLRGELKRVEEKTEGTESRINDLMRNVERMEPEKIREDFSVLSTSTNEGLKRVEEKTESRINDLVRIVERMEPEKIREDFSVLSTSTNESLKRVEEKTESRINDLVRIVERVDPEKMRKEIEEENDRKLQATSRHLSEENKSRESRTVKLAEERAEEIAKETVKLHSVANKDFKRLKEAVEKLGGRMDVEERIEKISTLFNPSPRVLLWQCKLVHLLMRGGGLAPDVEEEALRREGIPIGEGRKFLGRLRERGFVETKNIFCYNLSPEHLWLLEYTKDLEWLREQLEEYSKKRVERDYQKYIRENIGVVEEGLIVVDEEYAVPSGRIDILSRDKEGREMILELKYPKPNSDVVGQLLKYREDLKKKIGREEVRTVLVAPVVPQKIMDSLGQHEIEWREVKWSG